jgi:hypothetical protein
LGNALAAQGLGEAHVADFDRDHNQAGLGAPLSVASIGPPDRGQADAIDAVRIQGATGRGLVAFFGCMYYAGMRPSEVVDCGTPT